MVQPSIYQQKEEFEKYFYSKELSVSLGRKFLSSFKQHVNGNPRSFLHFWKFICANQHLPIEQSLSNLNLAIRNKNLGYKTLNFIINWSHSYLGPGELICLLLCEQIYSGRKNKPDLLFRDSNRKIEVKSYSNNFRLSESTSFFTDLGTIIQALVQGGFLASLTDINHTELRRGLKHFCESFLCPRGYIELNGKIWSLESKDDERIIFKASPETSKDAVNYSIVRNSLRNWLGRGLLSVELAAIIDPTRTKKITRRELIDYVNFLLGIGDFPPIPLEQYFVMSGLDSLIIYDKTDKSPFILYTQEELDNFVIDRVGQAKVSYKKLETEL
jgi:hypothetical protein